MRNVRAAHTTALPPTVSTAGPFVETVDVQVYALAKMLKYQNLQALRSEAF